MRMAIGAAVACLTLIGLSHAADVEAAIKRHTDIPAQGLAPALRSLAKDRGFQIVFASQEVSDLRTQGAVGEFTTTEALTQILTGTGLTYRYLDDNTITIAPLSSNSAIPGSGATPGENTLPASGGKALSTSEGNPPSPREGRRAGDEGTQRDEEKPKGFWRRLKLAQADSDSTENKKSDQASDKKTENQVQEITVTAQKREERLQDVPISISVLSQEGLESGAVTSVNDALRAVPGVAMYENNQAAGMTKIAIRGVTSNSSIFNGSTTVGYYLDELPFALVRFPVSPDANAYDLERVEVLRGPQGTLYGANSMNGVVRVVTEDANLDRFEGRARGTVSSTEDGGGNYRGDFALNVPLIPGALAVRGVVGYSDDSGWIDAPLLGREGINEGVSRNYRFKVNGEFGENLDVEYLTWIARNERDGATYSADGRVVATAVPEPNESNYDLHVLTLTYDFPWARLTSATSLLDFEGLSAFNIPFGTNDALNNRLTSDMFSQEIRIASTAKGSWRWSAGAIYRDAEDVRFQKFTLSTANPLPIHQIYGSESYAAYGEITRLFMDGKLELTGGLRFFRDTNAVEELSAFTVVALAGYKEEEFEAWTPRAVLAYHPAANSTIYGSYSQGFRSGFAQDANILRNAPLAPSAEPDRLHNYEIGTKGSVLDGRLVYDLSAYYINWKNTVQVVGFIVPPGGITFNGAINASAVRGEGADAALSFNAGGGFDIGVNASWNDLTFADPVLSRLANGTQLEIYAAGSRPVESPELTAGVFANYRFPLSGGFGGELSGGLDYTTKMRIVSVVANQARELNGDNLTQARASFSITAPAGWRVTAFASNLTDEDGKVRFNDTTTFALADRLRPRTIGVQFDLDF